MPTYRETIGCDWPIVTAYYVPKQARKVFVGPHAHLQYLNRASPGYYPIFDLPEDECSPIPFVGFPPFRRYGLALWDRKRLMTLELRGLVLDEKDYSDGDYLGIRLSPSKSYITLRSMMTEEDLQHWAEKRRQVLEGNLTYSIYNGMN